MRISASGLQHVKNSEGFRAKPYTCTGGKLTVGYGHAIKDGEDHLMNGVTREQADKILANDIKIAEAAVSRAVRVPLTQNQVDALISFTFNLGANNFFKSTLLQMVNNRQFKNAADQFLRWVHSGGKETPGLVKRRKLEREMFLKPAIRTVDDTARQPKPKQEPEQHVPEIDTQ